MSQARRAEFGQQMYLRSSLLVVRYERDRYVLVHPGSGSVMATDWLGARAARLLLRGYSEAEVARRVEQQAAGAGERLRSLTRRLVDIGAATDASPIRTVRWRMRVAGSLALGWLLTVFSALLRWAPLWALHLLYEALPETPLGTRTVGQSFAWMEDNLRAGGFANAPSQWRAEIARASGAISIRLSFFAYLCGLLPAERFGRFVSRVVDVDGFEALWQQAAQGGAVIACVHSDLYFAIPVYLRMRGMAVSCVADMFGLGVALASDRDIQHTFPRLFPWMCDSRGSMTGKGLLTRLRAGEVIMLAFDAPPQRETLGEEMPTITFLEHRVRRFDGPAWLALRSGKPLLVVGTFRRGKQTVPHVTVLQPDTTRPAREQIAALTAQMYTLGETFIRTHPAAWMVWSYFHELGPLCVGEAVEGGAARGAAALNTVGRVVSAEGR